MKKELLFGVLLIFLFQQLISGQQETYAVSISPFSSKKSDDFSPVYYKKGIVFCTNKSPNLFLNYFGSENRKKFNIYYTRSTPESNSGRSSMFSKKLSSKVNDGPATFNKNGDTIYFTRNLDLSHKRGNSSANGNKLGIFSAVFIDGKWTKIREFNYDNESYNITAPSLSPDAKRLFFASDKPGGNGGYDLYFCKWKGDYWGKPENLGPVINTSGNESYPFISATGDLFFSSDGHAGHGGTDIFFSEFSDQAWQLPVDLDPPINSKANDFGLITDSVMSEGYFSSDRKKPIDIYHFITRFPQVFYADIQKENNYCFNFRDTGTIVVDSSRLKSVWSFGDGNIAEKIEVKHCFQRPGDYKVRLDIIEKNSGKLFFSKLSYNLKIADTDQAYITSPGVSVKGEYNDFNGSKSNLPGFKIMNYTWNFGDGKKSSGEIVKHAYSAKGEYIVNLGLTLKSISTGKIKRTGVSKKIQITGDNKEKAIWLANESKKNIDFPVPHDSEDVKITNLYSAETEFREDAVFVVELVASKNQIRPDSTLFRNVPKKFRITEKHEPDGPLFCYNVDQQMNLMATYPAYREMTALGFKNVCIKIYMLKDQSEKELRNLIMINGAFADSYFDSSEKLTSGAYIMLDQIYKLMNKYPPMKLEVAVHTDNTGVAENNLAISQRHSQSLVNYLIKKGISNKRMVAMGFGGTKPISPNFLEKERKLNRRIDFIVIN